MMELMMRNEMEQLTNMELLTEALQARGFFVGLMENRLILQPGSGKGDLWFLRKLLSSLPIRASFYEEMVILDEVQFTEDLYERIAFFEAANQESHCPQHMRSWKTFTKRRHGYKINALNLDAGVAYLVKQLSKAGILTEMSCDGHGRRAPKVWFAGAWNAAWFEIAVGKLLSEESLHYQWIVKEERGNQILTANNPLLRRWNPAFVQEDAMKIGAYLDQHEVANREIKKKSFKYRSMKAQANHLSDNYPALKKWMEERVKTGHEFHG